MRLKLLGILVGLLLLAEMLLLWKYYHLYHRTITLEQEVWILDNDLRNLNGDVLMAVAKARAACNRLIKDTGP